MARGVLDVVLQHLRRTIRTPGAPVLTDGQLLERFLRDRDEGGFTTLVQRHSAMVMTVARRVLHDVHDAEDVFQATFLVLARKAGSICRRRALAGWLYQVAYHLALKVKAEKARRRARERQVRTMPQAAPDTNLNRAELWAVLDQELSRLPEKYRAPLVLHYFEGKSKDETAGQLGWTAGTVSGRLARARELLRGRLVRRGFVLSSAGIASLLVENTATAVVTPPLLSATIHAALNFAHGLTAASAVSASAATLARGMVRTMLLAKLKIVTAMVLVVSVLAAGAGAMAYRALAAKAQQDGLAPHHADNRQTALPRTELEAANETAPPEEQDNTARFSAAGKVVDVKGKPIAGAEIYLREQAQGWTSSNWHPSESRNAARTRTDRQGQFLFEKVKLPATRWLRKEAFPLDVIVMAKGYALAWTHLPAPAAKFDLSFTLQPESTIQGRLVDQNNEPISNVRVRALQLMALTAGPRPAHSSDDLLDLAAATFLDLEFSAVPLAAETDTDGRFVLRNLPPQVRVNLLIADDRILPKEVYAATTEKPQPQLVDYVAEHGGAKPTLRKETVHSNKFTLALEAGTHFHGTIVFEDTGKPAVGVRVSSSSSSSKPSVEADANGRFSIRQLPLRKYWARIYPPENTDYLGKTVAFELTDEKRSVNATVKLRRGVAITGKVVDEETGTGIPGVTIYHVPSTPKGQSWTTESKADGSFRIMAAPGKGQLIVPSGVAGYVAGDLSPVQSIHDVDSRFKRAIEIKEGQPVKGVTFALGRGFVISGRVLDPQGKPLSGARIHTRVPVGPSGYRPEEASSDKEGKFVLAGLKAGEEYMLICSNKPHTLAAVLTVPAAAADTKKMEVQVRLLPTAALSGRIVDEDNKPVAGATARVYTARTRTMWEVSASALTDVHGKFKVTRVVPGAEASIDAWAEGYSSVSSHRLKPESGKDHAVPDITLIKMDETVAGLIVDQGGKPVPGVQVYATSEHPLRPQVARRRPTTDSDGRFRITGLPRGTIQVRGVLPWDREHSSLLQRVKAGEQNAKIVVVVPDGVRAREAAVGKVAPEFPVKKWLNRKDAPSARGFVIKDFHNSAVLLAFLDDAKPSQRLVKSLNDLDRRYSAKGLVIVRVHETPAAESDLARISPTSVALVQPGLVAGRYNEAALKYGVRATPTLFLIDRKGILRHADAEVDGLEKRIEGLLTR